MPYTVTSGILTLCDALVSSIEDDWDNAAPDEVERLYQTPAATAIKSLTGRKVWIFPATYSDEPADRGEDLKAYRIGIIVVERYEGAGPVPTEWVDERVDWVETLAADWLEFGRDEDHPLLSIGTREIYTATREPVAVYDPGELIKRSLFWSELEFTFEEVA